MRLDHYFDDERALVRVRRMPNVEAQQRRLRHSLFRLRCDAGVGLDGGAVPGSDPQMRLRWSDDDGSVWSAEIWRSAGKIGRHGQVVASGGCSGSRGSGATSCDVLIRCR